MKRISLVFLLTSFFLMTIKAQNQETPSTYILLKNAMIIDCIGEVPKQGDLLIKDQQIENITYETAIEPPLGAIIYDLTGKFILPGLIDAHVHFATSPSGGDNVIDTKKRLKYLLKNGITSVRDMAGDTRVLGYLARAASLNEIPSPSIYYSALMAGPSFFDDPRTHSSARGVIPGNCPWMKGVDLATDMDLAIAEAKGTGATGIKVYADLAAPVVQQIVKAAHAQNIKVWSHATVFPARPRELVDAGVDVVSHANLLAWEGVTNLSTNAKQRYATQEKFDINNPVFKELILAMKDKGTIIDATLALYQQERFDTTIYGQGIALTQLAYKNGVKIGVGTDQSVDDFPADHPLFEEMEVLVKAVGMQPIEVLKAVTLVNAEIMGLEEKIGSLAVGKNADILVLDKNPLLDIKDIGSQKYVFKNGQRIDF